MKRRRKRPQRRPRPRRRWWKRLLAGVAVGLAVLVTVVVGLVAIVVSTSAGTGFALRRAVAWYDDAIPGHVSIEGSEGALAEDLCIHGLRLADAADRTLVTVQALCLSPRLGALLGRTVELERLALVDAQLHLWPDAAWGDLAPPSEPPPPDELPGPDLPVRIVGPLLVVGLDVESHGPLDAVESLVRGAGLHAELHAEGRRARVVVASVWGQLPAASAFVVGGHAAVQWDSPTLTVERLAVASSFGIVEGATARLDTLATTYAAEVRGTAFVPATDDTPAVHAPVRVQAHGTAEHAAAGVKVQAPGVGHAELHARVRLQPDLGGIVIAQVMPSPGLGIPPLHAFITALRREGTLRAHVLATAPGVLLTAAWDGTRAQARAFMDGVDVDVAATIEDGAMREAGGTVTVASAADATAALDRLLPMEVPRIEGAGRVAATCRSGAAWRCRVQAAVQRDADRLETAAVIGVGEGIAIWIDHLAGELRGQPVRLAAPVEVTVGDGSLSLTPLRLAAAGGTIEASGRVAWEGASDLVVRLARLDLGIVADFVPAVPIRGRLGGSLAFQGDLRHPALDVALDVARLHWGKEDLGRVKLRAGYHDRRARADVSWQHGPATTVQVLADVPIDLDVEGKTVRLREDVSLRASVEVRRLELAHVARWVDGPSIEGRVDGSVHAAGRLPDPIVHADLTATHLRVEDEAIGRARITATARDGGLLATLGVRGPAVEQLHVEATVPLGLRPSRGGIEYDPRGPHQLDARLVGLRLHCLQPWLGEDPPNLAGSVRGQVQASADAGTVRGRVELLGHDLVAVSYDVGAVQATVELGDGEVLAHVVLSGPWAREAELHARIPLAVDGLQRAPRWLADAPMSASVKLTDVELAGIGRLGPGPAIGGELRGTLALTGSARHPKLSSDLTIHDLTHGDKALGDVRVRSGYDGNELVAKLEQRHGAAKLVAWGRVPLLVDLATPTVTWHRDELHRLSVRAEGVDQDTVGILVELPEELRFRVAARVEARGTAAAPHAVVRLRGHVDSTDSLPLPISVQVDVQPEHQQARVLLGSGRPTGLVVDGRADAPLPQLLAGRGDASAIEVHVVARARDFQLRELTPFLPTSLHDPHGRLDLDASLQGPIAKPRLAGQLELRDAGLTVVPLRQQFEDIDMRTRFDGPDITLEHLRARSGAGTASVTGRLHVAPGDTRGTMDLVTRKLPVVRPGLPAMRLDVRVHADLDATGEVTALALEVHDGFLDVLAMSPLASAEPIPEDDGVVYVDVEGLAAPQLQAAAERTPWLPQDVAFSLSLADPLRVRGPSADMDVTGRFALLRRPNAPPDATGTFHTQGGRVSLLGHDFDIESAHLRFPEEGDLDPFIDLVATTDTSEALVTMLLRGRASRPQLELRSDPSMPESDIFALLVTGRADADEADDKEFAAKAAGVLAAVNNPALQRHLRERVGIDRVGVGFGESVDEPILTVGKRINEKLYVEAGYHHNAPRGKNEAEVRLEYRFAPPRWSVETFFGDAAQGGVGLWWTRRFSARGQRAAERRRAAERQDAERQAAERQAAERQRAAERADEPPSP